MKKSCIVVPEILLPQPFVDLSAWAVIACDQHTSDREYWNKLQQYVGDRPSTLYLTLPEVYLGDEDCSDRIDRIRETMQDYRRKHIFRKLPSGFILVRRTTPYQAMRTGIVLAIDLEEYSFAPNETARIRATEATIVERIPPRLKIRQAATIEFPHVLLLYEDPDDRVLKTIFQQELQPLYDFDLNMQGGHVTGSLISNSRAVVEVLDRLEKNGVLFMVGDGNHSLATAKTSWDIIKKTLSEQEREYHPARYALCEAVNLYDPGIVFEAIHRIVKGVNPQQFLDGFMPEGEGKGSVYIDGVKTSVAMPYEVPAAVFSVDQYIAGFISTHGGSVDYIHGEDALRTLTRQEKDCVGICLPKMNKSELFSQVLAHGCLPRKTFSMGESEEKRYYIEGKEIHL